MAESLSNLAGLYDDQGKYAEAEPLYKRSLEIYEKALGQDHPLIANMVEDMADFYLETGRTSEAEEMEERLKEIRSRNH